MRVYSITLFALVVIVFTACKQTASNLEILQLAREYDYNDNRKLNSYTYKQADSQDLVEIRNTFNLDSVVGENDEQSKLINLMTWVNQSFIYDGTKPHPEHSSIADLMTKCIEGDLSLHCGAMAWVLRDCYLSMGFKARQVVCFPKDPNDKECHSTVAVYSKDLKKWLFIDPSNCAYATNENNELMSFEELREALIKGNTIKLNKEVNRNGESLSSGFYLDYLAKDFYAFQCFSDKNGESISNLLLPIECEGDFFHTIQNNPKVTNNPNEFWQVPEE